MTINKFLITTICTLFVGFASKAQFGGGGGGFGGGGYGYGQQRMPGAANNFPPPKQKNPNDFDPEVFSTNQTKVMKKKLELDDEQEIKVDGINIKYAFKIFDLFEGFKKITAGLKPDERPSQEKIDEIRSKRDSIKTEITKMDEERNTELQKVLKPEQWEKYSKKKRTLMDEVAQQ
jgi:hypothetical protein